MDKINIDEAINMLPDGGNIHTFRNPSAGMMIGADWNRDDIIEAMNKHGVGLSGEQAKAMDHGLVLEDKSGFLFIETT